MEQKRKKKMMGSHFFKIMSNYIIDDRRLGLPSKFVKIFGEELGKAGLIEDPTGKIWPVELRRTEGEIYFHNGWQEFVDYFSVRVGHFLIFRYEGDSHFHVSICDKTVCEIEYPSHIEDADLSLPEQVSAGEIDHSIENMDVLFQCESRSAHTAANRTGTSCAASKRIRYEDYQKAGASVKRNKSDGFEENTCKPWAFTFNHHPEVVTISSDGGSEDEDYQSLGDSAEHNESGKTSETISCRPWAFNTINSESNGGCMMPMETESASHGGNHKIPKTGKVKVHCPGKDASCGTSNMDVSERKFQRAMSVIKEARAFKSAFPTCTIVMKPSYVAKGRAVHVPYEFARDYMAKRSGDFVTLKDSTGKKWDVGYSTVASASKASLYKGWYEFVLDNHLKVDDACVFELVDIDNLEMKVNIIRASPDMV